MTSTYVRRSTSFPEVLRTRRHSSSQKKRVFRDKEERKATINNSGIDLFLFRALPKLKKTQFLKQTGHKGAQWALWKYFRGLLFRVSLCSNESGKNCAYAMYSKLPQLSDVGKQEENQCTVVL